MKTEKEIQERIDKLYSEIIIVNNMIESKYPKGNLALETAILSIEEAIINLEWVLGKDDFIKNVLLKRLDKK